LPPDSDSFTAFTQARSGAPGSAYPLNELLPITLKTPQSGRTFALNPSLGGVQNLFNAGRAAIVANMGTLVTPATKAQINANSVPLPDSLFSHFDQTAAWQLLHRTWQWRTCGLGRRGCGCNRSHESEFKFHVHVHLHGGQCALPAGQSSFQLNVTPAGPIPIYGWRSLRLERRAPTNALSTDPGTMRQIWFAQEYQTVINGQSRRSRC